MFCQSQCTTLLLLLLLLALVEVVGQFSGSTGNLTHNHITGFFVLICFAFLSFSHLYYIILYIHTYIYIYIYFFLIGGKYCPARARAHFLFFPLSDGT